MTRRCPSGDRATGTPSPYTSNENLTLPGGTFSARRSARHRHTPASSGRVALHITMLLVLDQEPEKTTFAKVVTPVPKAVGFAARVVV